MIIDRYLLRQVTMPCFMVTGVLLIIFVGYSLSRFLTQADAGLLNTGEVVQLTLLKVLIALEVLAPVGLFFGLLLGLGKLHSDSEIVALQASGLGEPRMLRPLAGLAIPLAVLVAVLSFYIRPWAYAQTYQVLAVAEASSDIDRIKPGQFYLTRETPAAGRVSLSEGETSSVVEDEERAIFIETMSAGQELEHVFIRTRVGEELQVVSARSGLLIERPAQAHHLLELNDARIYKRVEDGPDLVARIGEFTMKVKNELPEPPAYKSKAVASAALVDSSNPKDRAEYQWRLSTPVTTLLLALLAVPLSRTRPRQGRYARLLLAFVIYAAYYNLIEVSQTWVKQQQASSIWWTPALLALLVVLLYLPWHALKRLLPGSRHAQA